MYPYTLNLKKKIQEDRMTEDYNKRLYVPPIHGSQAGVAWGENIDIAGSAGNVIKTLVGPAYRYTMVVKRSW